MNRAAFTWLVIALASPSAISCSGVREHSPNDVDGGAAGGPPEIPCASDSSCGGASACVANRCVQRATDVGSRAIEIDPPRGSGSQRTELPSVGGGTQVITASAEIELTVAVMSPSVPLPASASLILSVPSKIAGLPDLSFQGPFDPVSGTAKLLVPETVRGATASVSLIPVPPSDQMSWPYASTIAIPPPGRNPEMVLPANTFTLRGLVRDAVGTAKAQFTARAFRGGSLVSTAAMTAVGPNNLAGNFVVILPAEASDGITLELAPGTGTADPWVTLAGLSLTQPNTDLATLMLPTYRVPNAFLVTAHGGAGGAPVPGVMVRAHTALAGGDPRLSAKFFRDGLTDAGGAANLWLIPGTLDPQLYTISVIPAPGSIWASECIPGVPVPWIGEGTPAQLLLDVTLKRRHTIEGTVVSAGGTPVGNVVVTAIRETTATAPCLAGPSATSVITDATGSFTLPLDKGSYRLEYTPPAGAPVPRLTQVGVAVELDETRVVRLPAAVLVEGDVRNAAAAPLPNATIRIFDTRTTPPLLQAETQADGNGHFRAVVAAPGPS